MKKSTGRWLEVLGLVALAACSGGGGGPDGEEEVPECDKAANVAVRDGLLAAQPALVVKASSGKTVKTLAKTWASVAGNPSVQCSVDLEFKDLDDDGALQPYEDWSLTAAQRSADLVGRMAAADKLALMAHPVVGDLPTVANPAPSSATIALIDAGVRFAQTTAATSQLTPRANWANAIQERCEASALGIPFVLSMAPSHSAGGFRVKARGFSQWPVEAGFGATGDVALVRTFGQIVAQEYRAIGVRMALEVSGNLATDPRWWGSQFSFGEDAAVVGDLVDAYVGGLQGDTLGASGVAAVVAGFPGAGAAKGGLDGRFEDGKLLAFTGTHFDEHVGVFARALTRGAAAITPAYGLPEAGAWTGLAGLVDGAGIEQVAASFHAGLLTDVLREHYAFGGLVIAPAGVLEDVGLSPLGAPWGVEGLDRAGRIGKAAGAGVDQFLGLSDLTALAGAGLSAAQVDASAARVLTLMFELGLFEDPYVDAAAAPGRCNTDAAYTAGLDAMNRGMVLLRNVAKPVDWLNGAGDGTQTADKGNAGNGSGLVLPAPPGEPYVSAGCDFYVAGDFDLTYVGSVSNGYGNMVNNAPTVKGVSTPTDAAKMAMADYVFIRIAAPYTADPATGSFAYGLPSLSYEGNDPGVLAPIEAARAAIDGWTGPPASKTQIVVIVDAGRPSVVSELLSPTYGVSALYVDWMGLTPPNVTDKVALDVTFGIVDGRGRLPVGLPASDEAAAPQLPDVAADGQDATLVAGYGLQTNKF